MKHFEFSKLILCCVMATYFIGLVFGMAVIVCSNDSTHLGELFVYIGAPVSVAIAFYSYKAKAENVEKLRHEERMRAEGEENENK